MRRRDCLRAKGRSRHAARHHDGAAFQPLGKHVDPHGAQEHERIGLSRQGNDGAPVLFPDVGLHRVPVDKGQMSKAADDAAARERLPLIGV